MRRMLFAFFGFYPAANSPHDGDFSAFSMRHDSSGFGENRKDGGDSSSGIIEGFPTQQGTRHSNARRKR